jgi:hypothetical protein
VRRIAGVSARSWFFVVTACAALAAILLLGVAGRILGLSRTPERRATSAPWMAGAVLLLFLVLGGSLLPLMLRAFLVMQAGIGNSELWIVRALREHETGVVYAVWSMFALGTLIALPVMAKDMLGKDMLAVFSGPGKSKGTLVIDVGMPLSDVRAQSTLKLVEESRGGLTPTGRVIARVTFDLQIAGSALRFEQCRYYWIHTDGSEGARVQDVNVGISPRKMSRAALGEAHADVQQRLREDDWLAGAIHYRTPEEQQLHGGATSSGQGFYWARGGTVLQLSGKRVDEVRAGEDPETAGEWIQILELRPRGVSRIEFD